MTKKYKINFKMEKKMEYFDVVDENRNSLNKKLPRGAELQENEFNVGVECLIINSNKEILLTQRSPQKSHSYCWEATGGCSISGETSIQTLKREILEEIGISIKEFKLVTTKLYKKQFVDIYVTYLNIDINDVKLQQEEVIQAKWFSLEGLYKLKEQNLIVPSTMISFEIIQQLLS